MAIFYSPMCPGYSRGKSMSLAIWYRDATRNLQVESYPEVWTKYPPAVEFTRRSEVLALTAGAIQQRAAMRILLSLVAGAYLPLFLSNLVLSAALLFRPADRRRLGWFAVLVLFVYSYNAASCLAVAVVNSLDVPRYNTIQIFFTILAQFLALWFLCEVSLLKRQRASLRNT